jgi:hypothetical protein
MDISKIMGLQFGRGLFKRSLWYSVVFYLMKQDVETWGNIGSTLNLMKPQQWPPFTTVSMQQCFEGITSLHLVVTKKSILCIYIYMKKKVRTKFSKKSCMV